MGSIRICGHSPWVVRAFKSGWPWLGVRKFYRLARCSANVYGTHLTKVMTKVVAVKGRLGRVPTHQRDWPKHPTSRHVVVCRTGSAQTLQEYTLDETSFRDAVCLLLDNDPLLAGNLA